MASVRRLPRLTIWVCLAWLIQREPGRAAPPETNSPAQAASRAEFFESRIRPLLIARCFECHGESKQESGLRLDSREGWIRGGDRGPVLRMDDPAASRVLVAISYENSDLQMPPNGKLTPEQLADLRSWIDDGLFWPEAAQPSGLDHARAARDHWSFRPVSDPPIPATRDAAWPRSVLDAFILSRLENAGISPSPEATRRDWLRRVSYDLVGLPPTKAEIEAFSADDSPEAFERVVDRLLASPRFGERWGRHWLDLARYADNKGYKFFGSNDFFGYTYRDWVIRAFNDDLPYDEFLIRQLAADQLVSPDDTRELAAMGFLTVGRRFLEDIEDIIDDRIDVVTRGLLGLTVTCARCHDHKFDPIPTADYYSLYGVFAGCAEKTRTLRVAATQPEAEAKYSRELESLEKDVDDYLETRHGELVSEFRSRIAEYMLAGRLAQRAPTTDKFMYVEEPGALSLLITGRWRFLFDRAEREHDPIFAPWLAFSKIDERDFARQTATLAARYAKPEPSDPPLNARVSALFDGEPPANMREVAERYSRLLQTVEREWRDLLEQAKAKGEAPPLELPEPGDESLRRVLYGPLSPCDASLSEVEFLVGRPGQAKIGELRKKVEAFAAANPIRLARATVLEDVPLLYRYQPRIFLRGKSTRLGPETPRAFLTAIAGENRVPFRNGSGRLELAQAIANPENPLTARVIVNRAWALHFGTGLVATPSDFGLRGEPPTHPELLDFLARRFTREGWSPKRLHREIVLSAAYRQASVERPECRRIDPDNRLLWRAKRRRLDFEATRDSLLFAAGRLDPAIGGTPASLTRAPFSTRRAVYGYVDRENLPGLFSAFDFANPDSHSPARFTTTVPQQALFLLNSPFVVEQARGALARAGALARTEASTSDAARVAALYEAILDRDPDETEIALALDFLRNESGAPVDERRRAWRYGYGAFDATARRVTSFQDFKVWTGERQQGGPDLPDASIGWAYLDAAGGHPGADLDHVVIRRWTAPRDGAVSVHGRLIHGESEGDGVRGRIVIDEGQVGQEWTVKNSTEETNLTSVEMKAGQTIDLVVDCLASISNDQHVWTVKITYLPPTRQKALESGDTSAARSVESNQANSARDAPGRILATRDDSSRGDTSRDDAVGAPAGAASTDEIQSWNSREDFGGAELTPWEQFAQALLLTNEFVFVD